MKYPVFILPILLFVSAGNISAQHSANKSKADSVLQESICPSLIKQMHYEKKYDNAVWLAYISNFHSNKVKCEFDIDHSKTYKDTSIISFYPQLIALGGPYNGDTIEFIMMFSKPDGECNCYPKQAVRYETFGFRKECDSVIYRCFGSHVASKDEHGKMWNKSDSLEKLNWVKRHGKIPSQNGMGSQEIYPFDRAAGDYPLDEETKLFIQYLKAHKKQISLPLMRLCKERKIF